MSVLLTILALSLTAALLGAGPASASPLDPPGGTTDSQTTPGGGDPGGGGSDPCDLYGPETCMENPGGGGGGGGGGGEIVIPPGLPSPQDAQRGVDNTRLAAKRALVDKPRCLDTLRLNSGSPDPIKVLDTVPVLFVNQTTAAAAYASGKGLDGRISILPGFFFLNIDQPSVFGYVDPQIYFELPTVDVSAADLQLVAMLHELGHLTGVNVHSNDDGPPNPDNVNRKFNTKLYVNCLDQGAIYQ